MEQKQRDKKEKIKKYPTVPERWRIIICIWLKEIEKDSSVSASSFLFNGEKLINFSATLSTDAEFVWGYYTKIVRDRFREGLLSMTLFWQKNKSRHSMIFLQEDTTMIFEKSSPKPSTPDYVTRGSFKRIVQENRSRGSFEIIIFTPSSDLTRELWRGCEYYSLVNNSRLNSWVAFKIKVVFKNAPESPFSI